MVKNATDIRNEFPKNKYIDKIRILDPNLWALESYNYAKDFVYKNIQENGIPSQQYLQGGQKIAREALALAGYRLAELFKEISRVQALPALEDDE